jgi:uncharacterized protein YgiM (DUF1202 family)
MKGFLIGLSKFILGMAIALALLSMAGVATARYFMARLAVLPPKPLYGAEVPASPPPDPAAAPDAAAEAPAAPPPEAAAAPAAVPAAAPAAVLAAAPAAEPAAESAEAPAAEALPPGSYRAVVSQPIGLIVRSGPGTEHGQVGGVNHNAELVVLEEPAGQGWIKVRVASTGAEGWVKAGNTRRQD